MQRIPYDSEIIHFLNHWLNVDETKFKKEHEGSLETLVTRIHDCCCLVLHGIKLRKTKQPGKHRPWTRKLKMSEREFLDDPALVLTPQKRTKRIIPVHSPLHKSLDNSKKKTSIASKTQSIATQPSESKKSDEKEQECKPSEVSFTDFVSPNQKSCSEKKLSKKDQSFAPVVTFPEKNISEDKTPPLKLKNNSSNSETVDEASPVISIQKNQKETASNSKSIAVPSQASNSKTVAVPGPVVSNEKKEQVTASVAPTEWAVNRYLLQSLGLFPSDTTPLPKSWMSKKGASNPQAVLLPKISEQVITQSLLDLDQICLTDLECQLDQEELDDDGPQNNFLIDDLKNEISELKKGRTVTYSECTIELQRSTLKHFLKQLFYGNISWDLGFQMRHLKTNDKDRKYSNVPLSTKCYCPCSNYFKSWREKCKIESIFCKEVTKCKGKGVFNNTLSFFQHCADLGESCMIHRSMLSFLRHLYPSQTQNQIIHNKKKLSTRLNFGNRKTYNVSIPKPIKLTIYKFKTFSITR